MSSTPTTQPGFEPLDDEELLMIKQRREEKAKKVEAERREKEEEEKEKAKKAETERLEKEKAEAKRKQAERREKAEKEKAKEKEKKKAEAERTTEAGKGNEEAGQQDQGENPESEKEPGESEDSATAKAKLDEITKTLMETGRGWTATSSQTTEARESGTKVVKTYSRKLKGVSDSIFERDDLNHLCIQNSNAVVEDDSDVIMTGRKRGKGVSDDLIFDRGKVTTQACRSRKQSSIVTQTES